MADYVEAVANRVVVYDSAMGTSLQQAELSADDFGGEDFEGCNELLNVGRPEVVAAVHASFLEVGVDVIETNSFGGFSIPLSEYRLGHRVNELNVAAARIAREVAVEIRVDWGFADEDGPSLHTLFRQQYRGGRHSWGYSACPDLEDNARVTGLLDADRIGVAVGVETGWQYQPEQTT